MWNRGYQNNPSHVIDGQNCNCGRFLIPSSCQSNRLFRSKSLNNGQVADKTQGNVGLPLPLNDSWICYEIPTHNPDQKRSMSLPKMRCYCFEISLGKGSQLIFDNIIKSAANIRNTWKKFIVINLKPHPLKRPQPQLKY